MQTRCYVDKFSQIKLRIFHEIKLFLKYLSINHFSYHSVWRSGLVIWNLLNPTVMISLADVALINCRTLRVFHPAESTYVSVRDRNLHKSQTSTFCLCPVLLGFRQIQIRNKLALQGPLRYIFFGNIPCVFFVTVNKGGKTWYVNRVICALNK